MTQQPTSLQKRLIRNTMISSVVAGIIALLLLFGFSVYQSMNTHDNIMDELSDMLLVSDLSAVSGSQVDELSDEFEMVYQFRFQQQILSESPNFPSQLFPTQQQEIQDDDSEFTFVWQAGTLWRSYSYHDAERELSVRVYQPLSERFQDFFQSFFVYALCLIVLWLLQWLFLNYVIKKQFKSIAKLSQHIGEKNADDLSPIDASTAFMELQPMLKQLNLLLLRVQQSLVAEQRFTADASHELRSPLSAIQMRLQLIQRKYAQSHPEMLQDLNQIQQDVKRGTQTLENLLLLARLDPSGLQGLEKSRFDLNELIDDVRQSVHIFAQEKKIQFHVTQSSIHWQQTLWIAANRDLIFICLRNVFDNAIRYAQRNGQVYVNYGQVGEQTHSDVFIEIEDNGQQLTTEILEKMGERFYRALGTQTQGTGLGLSICHKIIELHQGSMQLSQSEYGGLKVRFDLMLK